MKCFYDNGKDSSHHKRKFNKLACLFCVYYNRCKEKGNEKKVKRSV